jgi:gluconolactonase
LLACGADETFNAKVDRIDAALDKLIQKDAKVEKLAEGFNWSEGPAWYQGSVVFSDVPENVIYQWKEGSKEATVFHKPSGGMESTPDFREPGSNGLATDAQGNLIICQHGKRRLVRLEADKRETPLVETFEGKRFNSPNDLVIHSNGDIYFTDPPYGPRGFGQVAAEGAAVQRGLSAGEEWRGDAPHEGAEFSQWHRAEPG